MMKLTEKQKRFCEEYLIDLNATQAAIRAGYSSKNASRIAVELLNKTQVSDFLEKTRKEQSERTGITADAVLKELEKIAFIDVELSSKDKMKALELLGKHLGMFEKQEITATVEIKDDPLSESLKNLAKELEKE